nr:VOC family protein [Microthrixaceae bacterium]
RQHVSDRREDGHADHGFTHVALQVTSLDSSLEFYERFADMTAVHRRTGDDGSKVAWISDHTRPFVVVLIEAAEGAAGAVRPLGGWNHLGIAVASRDEVDRRIAEAARAGFATLAASDSGPPVGYFGVIVDPDGHNLELAFGQEVAFTVQHTP